MLSLLAPGRVFKPFAGPSTVPSFSDETPESNFQRSQVQSASRRQKTQHYLRHSGSGIGGRDLPSFSKAGSAASAPDQFVGTKLSQLEVPEAYRTNPLLRAPGFSGEVKLSALFQIVNGFFQIRAFFSFRATVRFSGRASTLAGSRRRSTSFLNFLFSGSPAFSGRAPRLSLRGGEISGYVAEVNGFFEESSERAA